MPLYLPAGGSLTVEEEDGTPSVAGVTKIQVPNTSLTNDSGTIVSFGYATSGDAFAPDSHLPWHVWVIPMITTPDATTGTWGLQGNTEASVTFPFYQPGTTANSGAVVGVNNSTAAQNDAWAVDVILAAGTWDAHFHVRKSTNTGIITLNMDAASQGTVDTYAAAAAYAKVSISGFTVATTGKKRMQALMATKNASSSAYVLTFYGLEFRRTA